MEETIARMILGFIIGLLAGKFARYYLQKALGRDYLHRWVQKLLIKCNIQL